MPGSSCVLYCLAFLCLCVGYVCWSCGVKRGLAMVTYVLGGKWVVVRGMLNNRIYIYVGCGCIMLCVIVCAGIRLAVRQLILKMHAAIRVPSSWILRITRKPTDKTETPTTRTVASEQFGRLFASILLHINTPQRAIIHKHSPTHSTPPPHPPHMWLPHNTPHQHLSHNTLRPLNANAFLITRLLRVFRVFRINISLFGLHKDSLSLWARRYIYIFL